MSRFFSILTLFSLFFLCTACAPGLDQENAHCTIPTTNNPEVVSQRGSSGIPGFSY